MLQSITQVYRPSLGKPRPAFATGQLTVQFKTPPSPNQLKAFHKQYGTTLKGTLDLSGDGTTAVHYLTFKVSKDPTDALQETQEKRRQLSKDPNVASADMVALYYAARS